MDRLRGPLILPDPRHRPLIDAAKHYGHDRPLHLPKRGLSAARRGFGRDGLTSELIRRFSSLTTAPGTQLSASTGSGKFRHLAVSAWLAERLAAIESGDPFDRLLEELLKAEAWLSMVPPPHNRHSFTIGAFVGSTPVFALVINYEGLSGSIAKTAAANLSVLQERPTKPKTFVSGQKQALSRDTRWRLAALAARQTDPERVFLALSDVNREAANRNELISSGCFTTYVRRTGQGGGRGHDIAVPASALALGLPQGASDAITKLLDEQFGPGRGQLVGISTVRSDSSDEYHAIQLRDKADDPNTHSNYGAFLDDKKGDLAEPSGSTEKLSNWTPSTSTHWETWQTYSQAKETWKRPRVCIARHLPLLLATKARGGPIRLDSLPGVG